MITTLLVLSIIGSICITCMGLAYSNANIFLLEYKGRVLRESSLSGIEIAKSNILLIVKDAIKKSKNKEEFNNYFLGNGSNYFCETIKKVNGTGLKDVSVRVVNSNIYEENGVICFQLISEASENKFSKIYRVDVKIKNPFLNVKESVNSSLEDNDDIEQTKTEKNNEILKIDELEKEDSTQGIRKDLDEKSLVILQNYMEM